MTARCDYISTFDFLNFRCDVLPLPCSVCFNYSSCKIFSVQMKLVSYIVHTMLYSEGEV